MANKAAKFLKRCNCCGKFLLRNRWMVIGGYHYKNGYRPICWNCDADYY